MERIDPHAELERVADDAAFAAWLGRHGQGGLIAGLVDVAEDGQTSIGVAGEQMPLDGLAAIRIGLEG